MPSVMSIATEIAVPVRGAGDGDQQDPGHDVRDVRLARRTGAPAEPGAERAAEDVHEEQQEHDRHAGDEDDQRG